jgi:hypothetical protein
MERVSRLSWPTLLPSGRRRYPSYNARRAGIRQASQLIHHPLTALICFRIDIAVSQAIAFFAALIP